MEPLKTMVRLSTPMISSFIDTFFSNDAVRRLCKFTVVARIPLAMMDMVLAIVVCRSYVSDICLVGCSRRLPRRIYVSFAARHAFAGQNCESPQHFRSSKSLSRTGKSKIEHYWLSALCRPSHLSSVFTGRSFVPFITVIFSCIPFNQSLDET